MIVLVLGGARSGKSEFAERRAADLAGEGSVTYVATAPPTADLAPRIAVHAARRPASWSTVEAGAGLVDALTALEDGATALVDSLGAWVAATPEFAVDVEALCGVLTARRGATVIVSEEVGLSVHPSTEVGNRFRDALGIVNQRVAAVADEALLVVAGRALRLEPRP